MNNSLIAYPDVKKDAYFAVADSLRDVLGAAEIPKFMWSPGEIMTLVPWLFNDTKNGVRGRVTLSVTVRGKTSVLGTAELEAKPLCHAKGGPLPFRIPDDAENKERFLVAAVLETEDGDQTTNTYELVIEQK